MWQSLIAKGTWLLGPETPREGRSGHLWARWIFLRTLGFVYFSAFYALLFQIKGLMGPNGLLPVADYLQVVAAAMPASRFQFAPSLFWISASNHALMTVVWTGLAASVLVFLNVCPRWSSLVCFVCFVSFVSTAQDFSGYQSDSMLLEAGFIALFFAPSGFRPGLAQASAPSRATLYLLRWEWFRIYFESGVAKWTSGDPSWHNFTALDQYYQNGPLPTWIGWYVQHLPHGFHAFTTGLTLIVELFLVWMVFLPRRVRIACFCLVTPFEIGIILTANYAFLNYIELFLGVLLLDDRFLDRLLPGRFRFWILGDDHEPQDAKAVSAKTPNWRNVARIGGMWIAFACFATVFYVTTGKLFEELFPGRVHVSEEHPADWIEPLRIAQDYHLFGTMTPERLEIEFQGTADGKTWIPYEFRYKPQDIHRAPGIYAPYQPRFEWNLWFASLGSWRENRFVLSTEERLLQNQPEVLALFAKNPFPASRPVRVRSVIYQYWFTDMATKRATGNWWRRELLGEYAPALARDSDGSIQILPPSNLPIQSSE